ncbi:hypothetical protein M3Y95_00387100 [Aphelenchoides besseyi]|nr:hypothetical protein M3Y95_00387100 [Aphelenchoides besseyi]
MFVNWQNYVVTPIQLTSVHINNKIFQLIGIVSPEPDNRQHVWRSIEDDDRAVISFVYTKYGFFFIRALLMPGTFLVCTVRVDTRECVAAKAISACLHVRLIENERGESVLLLFGPVEKEKDGIYSNEVLSQLLGPIQPFGLAFQTSQLQFTAEFRITGSGLRLLRVHQTPLNLHVLPTNMSIYTHNDRSLNPQRLQAEAAERLAECGILEPLQIADVFACPFWESNWTR